MRRALLVALTLLCPTLATAAISVSPARLEKAVSPDNNTLDFVISNPSKVAVEITLSTAPVAHDRDGASIPGKPGYPYDASGLIHFDSPTHFTLAALRWRRIHAHVDVPNRAGGGYAYVYVRGIDANQDPTKAMAALRVGMVIELAFPNPGKVALAVQGLVEKKGELRVAVRNDGQIHVAPQGTLTLQDPSGKTVGTATLVGGNIFPGLVRDLKLTGLPDSLPPGDYTAKVAIQAPTEASFTEAVAVKDGKLSPVPGLAVLGSR